VFVAALLTPVLTPAPGHAQNRGEGIRVVETVDPVSGARYRQTVYDLTKKEIQAVQRALRQSGYLGVGWTGRLDPGTVRALGELQEDRGLYPCDCVSYETIVALGLKPDVEITTVAVGAAGARAYDPDDAYGSGYGPGILYPVAVPILVPVDSSGAIVPGVPTVSPSADAGSRPVYPPAGATPPGVRPLPPPSRVIPADAGSNPGSSSPRP
jgi:hypothetical protein